MHGKIPLLGPDNEVWKEETTGTVYRDVKLILYNWNPLSAIGTLISSFTTGTSECYRDVNLILYNWNPHRPPITVSVRWPWSRSAPHRPPITVSVRWECRFPFARSNLAQQSLGRVVLSSLFRLLYSLREIVKPYDIDEALSSLPPFHPPPTPLRLARRERGL